MGNKHTKSSPSPSPLDYSLHRSLSSSSEDIASLASNDPLVPSNSRKENYISNGFVCIAAPCTVYPYKIDNVGLWWQFVDNAKAVDSIKSRKNNENRALVGALLLRAYLLKQGNWPVIRTPKSESQTGLNNLLFQCQSLASLQPNPNNTYMEWIVEVRSSDGCQKTHVYILDQKYIPKSTDSSPVTIQTKPLMPGSIFNHLQNINVPRMTITIPESSDYSFDQIAQDIDTISMMVGHHPIIISSSGRAASPAATTATATAPQPTVVKN